MERLFFYRLPGCSKGKPQYGHYNLLTLTLLRTWAGIFRSNVGGKCLYNLHLRLHMHLVVWGCKHPRLEAVCTTELSVWCLRLLATPYCQVNLFIQYSLKSIPDLDTVLLLKCSFVFSCSDSVHVNILHSAVIDCHRGWEEVVYLNWLGMILGLKMECLHSHRLLHIIHELAWNRRLKGKKFEVLFVNCSGF